MTTKRVTCAMLGRDYALARAFVRREMEDFTEFRNLHPTQQETEIDVRMKDINTRLEQFYRDEVWWLRFESLSNCGIEQRELKLPGGTGLDFNILIQFDFGSWKATPFIGKRRIKK